MPPLPAELRKSLENAVITARDTAEAAARAALVTLAVERSEAFPTMNEEQKMLRRALRAKARQLGGGSQTEGVPQLVEEIAYQQWHRKLFARFLAENNLLMHPEGVAVTLQDCAELAAEEGAVPGGTVADAWELAARYASLMLPGIFLTDDPTCLVRFAPESRHALEKLIQDLPVADFTADDSLGWVYQFWQSKKKDEVNKSERKIGGADLYPVTQLFTEDYMVRFLLENSLGAWWAARHPHSPLVKTFTYLRFRDDGTPAAGTFPGWPDRAAQVTCMDPCGGSGHFVVAEFDMLRRMRMEEEGLSPAEAGDAVIRDNLFMLEIDPRCTQIATFALVFAAWKAGGYRPLPVPNIACSGIAVEGQLEDWLKLSSGDSRVRASLERLYNLFREAPTLGSLIDPAHVPAGERMWSAEYDEVAPLLERVLARERGVGDALAKVTGATAQGVAKAAKLLSVKYSLVATNVPYLGRGDHDDRLKTFADTHYTDASADLATIFLLRCASFVSPYGTCAIVTPQNWLFLVSYEAFRRRMLKRHRWDSLCWIGEKGFESSAAAGAFTVLFISSNSEPSDAHCFFGIDAAAPKSPGDKAKILRDEDLTLVPQLDQLRHPGARLSFAPLETGLLLSKCAASYQGIKTGDDARMRRCYWEISEITNRWRFCQSTVTQTKPYGGLESILDWSQNGKDLARLQGLGAWGKPGIAVSLMRELRCALYIGGPFDSNMSAIVVRHPRDLAAIWAFASTGGLNKAVRATFKKTNASDASLVEVPFDLSYWQGVASSLPALPSPNSNDPTQWLFNGLAVNSTDPLQVAIACLLDYHWPNQKRDPLDTCLEDGDGIVCLPSVAGKQPAAERLRGLLLAAYAGEWSLAVQQKLLADVGFKDKDLADWLRDGFFEQHCRLFHNRPFVWHIWDGRKDGFSALVNYHKLDGANLDKLIYTYLGNWIETQRAQAEQGVPGSDGRLVAALVLKKKLELIRDGEPPNDIYVRWKPLAEQPIGWNPDLNDGVRLNIRPFVTAGVLRSKFTINWKVDRGKNPDGSERINDLHFTRAEKMATR